MVRQMPMPTRVSQIYLFNLCNEKVTTHNPRKLSRREYKKDITGEIPKNTMFFTLAFLFPLFIFLYVLCSKFLLSSKTALLYPVSTLIRNLPRSLPVCILIRNFPRSKCYWTSPRCLSIYSNVSQLVQHSLLLNLLPVLSNSCVDPHIYILHITAFTSAK